MVPGLYNYVNEADRSLALVYQHNAITSLYSQGDRICPHIVCLSVIRDVTWSKNLAGA